MPSGGACGIHDPLQLQRGDHVLALVIGILAVLVQFNGVKARGHDDGAVLFGHDLVGLGVVDGSGLAELFADAALAGLHLDAAGRVDDRNVGNGLGEGGIDGGAGVQPPVKFVQRFFRGAFFLADAAA